MCTGTGIYATLEILLFYMQFIHVTYKNSHKNRTKLENIYDMTIWIL